MARETGSFFYAQVYSELRTIIMKSNEKVYTCYYCGDKRKKVRVWFAGRAFCSTLCFRDYGE